MLVPPLQVPALGQTRWGLASALPPPPSTSLGAPWEAMVAEAAAVWALSQQAGN